MGLLLAGSRNLCQGDRFVRDGRWEKGHAAGHQVSGKRIGLLGMGNIGQAIARRARGFDMQVLYHDRKPVPGLDYQWCADLIPWPMSDFLVLAASGGETNHGLIDFSVFNVMPETCVAD